MAKKTAPQPECYLIINACDEIYYVDALSHEAALKQAENEGQEYDDECDVKVIREADCKTFTRKVSRIWNKL